MHDMIRSTYLFVNLSDATEPVLNLVLEVKQEILEGTMCILMA